LPSPGAVSTPLYTLLNPCRRLEGLDLDVYAAIASRGGTSVQWGLDVANMVVGKARIRRTGDLAQ
jgi:hypothetical protein